MKGRASGFSLLELLVALAMIGVAFGALAYVQVTGFRVTRSSQGAAIAKDLGMKQLEILRGRGYQAYRDCTDGAAGCSGTEVDDEHPSFSVSWTITDAPAGVKLLSGTEPPALLGVEIQVTWEDTRYDLVGYLSCGDPGKTGTTETPCPRESLLTSGST